MIPCADPRAQYLAHKDEIAVAIHEVLEGGRYILGDQVAAFEREFASWVGVDHAVGVANGTDAIVVALRAGGIGPGDEVITVAHTAVATVAAIELAGAVPVLVDIEPATFTIDPAAVAAAITPRTRAIIAVHVYGQPADLQPLLDLARTHGIRLIEDCAQAHGARYHGRPVGSWGDIACYSFYPTKNLGALGDGGLVATRDADLASRARLLREYGWAERYISHIPGANTRLDELQAAVLRVKLRYLDADNARRRSLAALYDAELRGGPVVTPPRRPACEHVFHLYVVRAPHRDALQAHLKEAGVSALVHYPMPIHLQPAYHGRVTAGRGLPATELAAREVLSLPLFPELTDDQVRHVAAAVRTFDARG